MDLTQKEQANFLARQLRKESTKSENIFWELVRNRRFKNYKFYRQKALFYTFVQKKKFFIADFYCHQKKLVVEIDGAIHQKQMEYDKTREEIIKALGLKIIRFSNEEIETNIYSVTEKLMEILA